MDVKSNIWLMLLLMFLSSFVVVMGTESNDNSISKNPTERENGYGDKAENREKRSREEIMFGNQQNKPSGLVDDIMALPGRPEDDDSATKTEDSAKNATTDTQVDADQKKLEEVLKEDDKEDKKKEDIGRYSYDDLAEGNSYDNWYSNPQTPPDALQYLLSPQLQELPSDSDDETVGLYDQEVYRRKRQLLGHPLPLRKRSLRSPLGQMVSRGRRLPRRSMRLKRQVDVEDLLSLLDNIDNNNPRFFQDQGQNNVNQHVQDISQPEFHYPYNFLRHGDNEEEDGEEEQQDILPGSRFYENEFATPYRGRPDSEEPNAQDWMVRHPPQVFSVSRRSAPGFYPLDYRFMPVGASYRKRSARGGRWMPGSGNAIAEDEDTDFGKWGRIVQVPEAYASAEDVARLYALANLMAEPQDGQTRFRQRTL